MKRVYAWRAVPVGLAFGLWLSLVQPWSCAGVVLDWTTVSWPAGSLSQTFTGLDPGNPNGSITVSISGDTAAFASGYPADAASPVTGGTTGDSSLQLLLTFPNTLSNITVTVQFNNYSLGVQNVNFTLFDIDQGAHGQQTTYIDQISGISGQFGNNSPLAATITNVPSSPTYSVANNGTLSATVTGTSTIKSGQTGNGNATIDFGTNLLTQASFTFGSGPGVSGNPAQQAIGLFDINFKPNLPETHPALAAMALCGLVVGLGAARSLRRWRGV